MSNFWQRVSRCSTEARLVTEVRRRSRQALIVASPGLAPSPGQSFCRRTTLLFIVTHRARLPAMTWAIPVFHTSVLKEFDMNLRRSLISPVLAGAIALVASFPASADINGFLNGRSADPGDTSQRSIEVGVQDIDFSRLLGARFNFAVSSNVTGFANIATVDDALGGADGFSIGGGAFIFLPNQRISSAVDIGMKPTLNYYTADSASFERDVFTVGFEFLVSGKNAIANTPLNWFANAGLLVRINDGTDNSDTDLDPVVGGGLYMNLGNGQFFFGAEIFDGDFNPGVGYRFFL